MNGRVGEVQRKRGEQDASQKAQYDVAVESKQGKLSAAEEFRLKQLEEVTSKAGAEVTKVTFVHLANYAELSVPMRCLADSCSFVYCEWPAEMRGWFRAGEGPGSKEAAVARRHGREVQAEVFGGAPPAHPFIFQAHVGLEPPSLAVALISAVALIMRPALALPDCWSSIVVARFIRGTHFGRGAQCATRPACAIPGCW